MLATQEAQVIPVTQMKHFCTLVALPEADWDAAPLLNPALLTDCKSRRSNGPELTGLGLSWHWMLLTDSAKKKKTERRSDVAKQDLEEEKL